MIGEKIVITILKILSVIISSVVLRTLYDIL